MTTIHTPIESSAYDHHQIGAAINYDDWLEKGRGMAVGTVRNWGGRDYIKTHPSR